MDLEGGFKFYKKKIKSIFTTHIKQIEDNSFFSSFQYASFKEKVEGVSGIR